MTSDSDAPRRRKGAQIANRLSRSAKDGSPNSLQLMSRDETSAKAVNRDILCVSSSYIREMVEAMPDDCTPIRVPISARILDALVEIIYTTASAGPLEEISVKLLRDVNLPARNTHVLEELFPATAIFVSYDDLPELFVAAELFRLDNLTSRLRTFFRNNIQSVFLDKDFLVNWPYEDIVGFFKSIYAPVGPRYQASFLQSLREWAANHLIDLSVEVEVVQYIRNVGARSDCGEGPVPRALLITNYECYQFGGDALVNYSAGLQLRKIFSNNTDIDPYSNPIVIRGHHMFVITGRHLLVFDVRLGTLVRTYENVFRSSLSSKTLILWRDRVYCSADFTISEVTAHGVQALYTSRRGPVSRFAVIEHNENRLDFCYSSRDELYRTICDREGSVLDESRVLYKCIPIGAEEGYVFFWQPDEMVLAVKKAGTPMLLYRLKDEAFDYVHCGPVVYLKFLRHVAIVNTTNGLVRTISPVPTFGRLVACAV